MDLVTRKSIVDDDHRVRLMLMQWRIVERITPRVVTDRGEVYRILATIGGSILLHVG